MRQALGPGALGRPGGSGWGGRWEGASGWGRHVNPRPFHFISMYDKIHYKKKKKKGVSFVSGITYLETEKWTGWPNTFLSRVQELCVL